MAHSNGSCRWLTTRFSRERMPSVKYSTLWPSRSVSPAAAIRAMPTSFGPGSKSGRRGREAIGACLYLLFVRHTLTPKTDRVKFLEHLAVALPQGYPDLLCDPTGVLNCIDSAGASSMLSLSVGLPKLNRHVHGRTQTP